MKTAATHILRQVTPAYTGGVRVALVHAYLRKHEEVIAVAVEKVLALRERHYHWQHFVEVADAVKTHLGEHMLLLIALSVEADEAWWDNALQRACTDFIEQALPHDEKLSTKTSRHYLAETIVKRCYLAQMLRNVRKLWLRRNPPSKLRLSDLQK